MRTLLILFLVFLTVGGGRLEAEDPQITGFSEEGSAVHRALEARFEAELDPDDLRTWMRYLASRPHHVGSPFGREVAEFIAGRFREWGFETAVETYQVLFPIPTLRRLEMVAPTRFTALTVTTKLMVVRKPI